jgi:hypothetical protein
LDLDLVNRSAIWYLQELEATEDRGDLTTTGALYLLYQDKLVREKTRNAIKTGCELWVRTCRQQAAQRHRLAAAGRWMHWLQLVGLTGWERLCISWLQYGPPIGERSALRRIAEASLRVSHLCDQ